MDWVRPSPSPLFLSGGSSGFGMGAAEAHLFLSGGSGGFGLGAAEAPLFLSDGGCGGRLGAQAARAASPLFYGIVRLSATAASVAVPHLLNNGFSNGLATIASATVPLHLRDGVFLVRGMINIALIDKVRHIIMNVN